MKFLNKFIIILSVVLFSSRLNAQNNHQKKPNVILILTDDQGIGDLGCHGNPWLKTPNIDTFYKESVRFIDYHVSPVCTPTRGALITGQYPINNGAWATFKGRDALSKNAISIASLFKQNGYKTGLFGKWHLGDNYPSRPTDMGFDVAIHHLAGGVGELSDYWGNNYFDDTYYVNNQPKKFKGYCTDIWFKEAIKFIDNVKDSEEPFFIYLPTNAPHSPHYVADKYAAPYKALENIAYPNANFFGMIANIDENFGKLEEYLKQNNIADNTILIFMTDNGATGGISRDGKMGYNMGLRGRKTQHIEGGHRVPFFIRWKDGNVKGGWDINEVTAHIDVLPTLASLCNIPIPDNAQIDGLDLSPLIKKTTTKLKERTVFVHNRQDWKKPLDVEKTCLIKDNWRLVNGNELYQIDKDRKQKNNVADKYPEKVTQLLSANNAFLQEVKTRKEYNEFPSFIIGNANQKEIKLTIQHAIGDDRPIYKPEQVAVGVKNTNNTHALEVEKEGVYQISCRRWPKECPGPILGIPEENPKNLYNYKTISPKKVRIHIANQILEKDIYPTENEVLFTVNLEKGKTFLVNDFIEGDKKYGVYYTYVKYLEN
ncbi:arylsulfatase [Polaribacter reichenbachii]|uniref:arylsulfatase n=1 Tax=Polaribacter reichenbachii TaxID=996801 RepID=UPI0009F456FC|nr:arylsulfatase [Polaribacter reichenbachii]